MEIALSLKLIAKIIIWMIVSCIVTLAIVYPADHGTTKGQWWTAGIVVGIFTIWMFDIITFTFV